MPQRQQGAAQWWSKSDYFAVVSITNPGVAASAVHVVVQALGTATAGQDYADATTQTMTFPAGATGAQMLTINILDDAVAEETACLQHPGQYAHGRLPHPQPAPVRLSRAVSGRLPDLAGRPVRQLFAANKLETNGFAAGVCLLRADSGATTKLVVR